jgi:hypothetical protein
MGCFCYGWHTIAALGGSGSLEARESFAPSVSASVSGATQSRIVRRVAETLSVRI